MSALLLDHQIQVERIFCKVIYVMMLAETDFKAVRCNVMKYNTIIIVA